MDIISTQKYIRMSPKKIRPVVYMIKKMNPLKAVEALPYVKKRSALVLLKTIKSALANAKNKGLQSEKLEFKEILINEAPRLKRGRPASRGMWHPFKRRMSHIRVVLTTIKSEPKGSQSETGGIEKSKIETKGTKLNKKSLISSIKQKVGKERKI